MLPFFKLADQARHKSMDVLRGYVRDAELFKDHAGEGPLRALQSGQRSFIETPVIRHSIKFA
jgi:hypothetical protein